MGRNKYSFNQSNFDSMAESEKVSMIEQLITEHNQMADQLNDLETLTRQFKDDALQLANKINAAKGIFKVFRRIPLYAELLIFVTQFVATCERIFRQN